MITLENVTFGYKRKRPLFDHFSYNLVQGGIYGLLGRNGAGKSTLLYLMSGLLLPQAGRVCFRGVEVSKRLPQTLADLFVVPEEFMLPSVKLSDFVRLHGGFYPRFSEEDFRRYLRLFEMEGDWHLGGMSMGQKKKVFISFALAANTSLLLMDEPTNGLDILGKSQFRKLMAVGMSEERTLVISTHQVKDIERLLDRVAILDGSRMLFDESVERICRKLYFTETDDRSEVERALAAVPSVRGTRVMLPNTEGRESDLNLELLFNGTLEHPAEVTALFHSLNTDVQ